MATNPMRPDKPRLTPVWPLSVELQEIMKGGINNPAGRPLNIFATMAHNPRLLKRFMPFGGYFLNKGTVPAREREIVILRVGHNTGSVYEFGQHTVIGLREGLTEPEIAALVREPDDHGWTRKERTLIDMADEICAHDCVGERTWSALRDDWDDAQLCELVFLAGEYRMVAGFLNTMGVQLDERTPGWPD